MRAWPARRWLWLLAALTVLRLVIAAAIPLSPDEAYYWVWGRTLQAGYLDHPPMVALWIAAGTAVAGDTALGIRLLGPLSVALGSVLLARAAEDLFPGRGAGPLAAALLNATLLVGVGAVTMTPDTPLAFFWVAALWALARLQRTGDGRWWLCFGVFSGAALASKYTAVLLGAGAVLWLLLDPAARRWVLRWPLWAGGALAIAVFAPVIAWNAAHGWASFAKQGGRAAASGGDAGRWILELVAGQAGLATPIVLLLCVAGTAAALRAWRAEAGARLLLPFILPGAALFLWQATGSRVQGNWPSVLYPAAVIAAAALLRPRWRRLESPAIALGAALTAAVVVQAVAAPIPLRRSQDPTLARLGGWPEFAAAVAAEAERSGADFVAAEEYGLAAQLAFHLPPGIAVVAMDPRWAYFDLPAPPFGVTGLLVRSERRGEGPPLWPFARPDGGLARSRGGIEAERYRLFRVQTHRAEVFAQPPAATLPRPRR